MNVKKTLKERNNKYGDYTQGINASALIMEILQDYYISTQGGEMQINDICIFMPIVSKLLRAAGNPLHTDSLHDLGGYALLAEEYYKTEKKHA